MEKYCKIELFLFLCKKGSIFTNNLKIKHEKAITFWGVHGGGGGRGGACHRQGASPSPLK